MNDDEATERAGQPRPAPSPPSAVDAAEETESGVALPAAETLAPLAAAKRAAPPPRMPESIGGYRILRLLGEGGMGVVWEAEQQHPRRRVALKVMRQAYLGDSVHARLFQREAETLGRLKHPNIAAIHESGRTEDGRDFFVMELVEGETLGAWLKRRPKPITPAELALRLRLFCTVCDAVHSAHQRGVIHRDLKPANILVGDQGVAGELASGAVLPVVKVLDFGLARITDGDVADAAGATPLTEVGMIKGTLAYMAPEQARGDVAAIDVRTDTYALGILLYELLAGERPYDVGGTALAEAVRVICEKAPRSLAQHWSGTRRLDRDLETIVGKALAKEPDRRYGSAAALADDVERYLTSQPIAARPPSVVYQLRKLAARNRALVAGVAATLVALVAGLVVSSTLYFRAEKARAESALRAHELQQVTDFQEEMLAEIDVASAGKELFEDLRARQAAALAGRDLPAAERSAREAVFTAALADVNGTDTALAMIDRTILTPAVAELADRFAEQPLVDAFLKMAVANTYVRLGRHEQALALQLSALATRKRLLGDEHPETLRSQGVIADQYRGLGRNAEAEPLYLEVLEKRRRVLGEEHPDTITSITSYGNTLAAKGSYAEAEPLLREALALRRRVQGEEHGQTLIAINSLGFLLQEEGKLAEAEPLRREAVATARRVLGEEHPDTLIYLVNMGTLLEELGQREEAERYFREALEKRRRVLGEEHPRTLGVQYLLGRALHGQGRLGEAEAILREVLAKRSRLLGEEHRSALTTRRELAAVLLDRHHATEALALLAPVEAAARRVYAAESPDDLAALLELLGLTKLALADFPAAELLLLEAHTLLTQAPRATPAQKRHATESLVTLYTTWRTPSRETQAAEWQHALEALRSR